MTNEQWKQIEGYPDYEISDLGRVKRVTSRTCAKAGSILKTPPRSKDRPYPVVDLCRDGARRTMLVHQLVAHAFLGAAPFEGAEVNHLDGDKTNPIASNLEWCTSSGNKLHAYREGLSCAKGERNGQAKLTEAAVSHIRARATDAAATHKDLAAEFGVSERTIRHVIERKRWAHLP